MSIPGEFICPISQEIMRDPVLDPYGISYEREEIEKWISLYHCDPINRSRPLRIDQLVPNLALKAMIENHLLQHSTQQTPHVQTENISSNLSDYQFTLTPIIEYFETSTIVTLKTQSSAERLPVHILAVVDVSGSMADEVQVKTTNGVEQNGLSKLDVTKHALNTIITSLLDHDTMTLITFSTIAKLVAESITTDHIGKERLKGFVKAMTPDSQTNIWGGLQIALNCVERNINSNRSTTIFLLTDGMPNVNPSRGHEHVLKEQLGQMTQKCTINTFGFGYSLDSKLLRNLSTIGNGMYCFIPDAGFVGTVFINALSNHFLTCAIQPIITIKYLDGTETTHNLSLCKLGIDRSIFVKRTQPVSKIVVSYINAITQLENTSEYYPYDLDMENDYDVVLNNNNMNQTSQIFFTLQEDQHIEKILNEGIRTDLVKMIDRVITFGVSQRSNDIVNDFINDYIDHSINDYIRNILADVTGQIKMAISNADYFDKWGRHYLLSLGMSHELQNCSNFKDPGLQLYTNPAFENIRTNLDTLFLTIPAPVPTARTQNSSSTTRTRTTTMRSYHNSSAPCFSGLCVVQTPNGKVNVKDVKIGDKILSCFDRFVTVTHILHTTLEKPNKVVVFESGLIITPGHPVFINDVWYSPETLTDTTMNNTYSDDLYDFCVDEDHVIIVNNINCLTLGHNLTGNTLIEHKYLGSEHVIRDIENIGKLQMTPNIAKITERDVIRDDHLQIVSICLSTN